MTDVDAVGDYDFRLVDLYDEDNPDGPDHEFYRGLADERRAQIVLDLGCGTGILTVTMAADGRTVVGVDPSPAMIAFARGRPGADGVTWVVGDSSVAPREQFDFSIMTGNVAQHIMDGEWGRTLRDLRDRMSLGGTLAFESRNPAARAWEDWASDERSSRQTRHGELVEWMDVACTNDRTVQLSAHNLFTRTGEEVTSSQTLIFRSRAEIEDDLLKAGFDTEAVYRDWKLTPFDVSAKIMVFVARAN